MRAAYYVAGCIGLGLTISLPFFFDFGQNRETELKRQIVESERICLIEGVDSNACNKKSWLSYELEKRFGQCLWVDSKGET